MKLIQASKIWLKRVELCYEIVRNVRNSKARWKETYRYGDFGKTIVRLNFQCNSF